ncbi:MAG TPA: adenylate/guanylate cyclase domain-containing protein [Methylophilaceae bacterium]|nr:adenylate/guanylate cyclase domain-containing protein [Methylophilaceae bacterium]
MRHHGRYSFGLLTLILAVAWLIESQWLHMLAPLQTRLSDVMVAKHALKSSPDRDIVIVDVDERSLAEMSSSVGRWPWPRSMHAEMIEAIERQQPRAIVFDILFSDPDLTRPQDDAYFFVAVRATSNTYFPLLVLEDYAQAARIPLAQYGKALGIVPGPNADPKAGVTLLLPLIPMVETGRLGAHNAVNDADGVLRGYPVYHEKSGWRLPSLPAKVAQGLGYALPDSAWITLNWHGRALSHARVSYADVYADLQRKQPQRPANEFAGKIVIIGATANGLHDVRATPVDGFYPGVEILATAIDNLKNGDPLRPAPDWIPTAIGLLLLLALYAVFLRFRSVVRIGIALAVVTLLSLLASHAALSWRYVLPLLAPVVFAWLYYAIAALMEYLGERKARERAVQTFGRFLDPRVVQSLVNRGETTQSLSGRSGDISVLFSDIRGFTTLSEASTPEEVVELLNGYFTLQSGAVFGQEGTLDKYIGDAIMAFWGAPEHQPDHAARAVAAALDMSERLEKFRELAGPLGSELEIGIGVHSGPAVVGFIGSENRQDYTAIGDTVNLASRIEGHTKGICRVLVSEETKNRCEQQAASPYEFVDRGSFQVKGRLQPVRLFEPREKS